MARERKPPKLQNMSLKSLLKKLKIPTHTNRPRNWMEYLYNITLPIESSIERNDLWGILFIGSIALFVPPLFFFALIYVALKTNVRIAEREEKEKSKELEQLILFIQVNHLQSLTEAIEANPGLLYLNHKKHSLLYWCKYYNNSKAHLVIVQMIRKYPKEISSMAA